MKFVKTLGVVAVTGVGLYALALATMDFTEKGFDYIAAPVGEETEAPEFEITDEMKQEAEEKIGEVMEEIENELGEELEDEPTTESQPLDEEIPDPIWIGENPNETIKETNKQKY